MFYPFCLLLLTACSVHLGGLVTGPSADHRGLLLATPEGGQVALHLQQQQEFLVSLQGLYLEVWGKKRGQKISFDRWRVHQGPHGLETWVGLLKSHGEDLGLLDNNSGVIYVVDRDSHDLLRPLLGFPVLIEGYVDAPFRIHVTYYRDLRVVKESP